MNQKSLTLDSPLLFIYFNFFYIAQIVVLGLGTRCPPRDPSLPVSCSPAPHHVFPEGPLDEHGRNCSFLYLVDYIVCVVDLFIDNKQKATDLFIDNKQIWRNLFGISFLFGSG